MVVSFVGTKSRSSSVTFKFLSTALTKIAHKALSDTSVLSSTTIEDASKLRQRLNLGQDGAVHLCLFYKTRQKHAVGSGDGFPSHVPSTSVKKREIYTPAHAGTRHGAIYYFPKGILKWGSRGITFRTVRHQTGVVSYRNNGS